MKLLVCSFLLLVILEEYYCKPFLNADTVLKAIICDEKDHPTYLLPIYFPVVTSRYPPNSYNPYNRFNPNPSNYGPNYGPVNDGVWRGNSYQAQYGPPQQPVYNSYQNSPPNAMNGIPTASYATPSSMYGNPYSTNGTPYSTNGTPFSTNGIPYSPNGTPYPTNGTPNQGNDTPYSTNGTPNQVNGIPFSTIGTPNQVNGGTPFSTNGAPNQTNSSPNLANQITSGKPEVNPSQQIQSNIIPQRLPSVKTV